MSSPASILAPLADQNGAWAAKHLETDLVGWLTTVAPDGRVQSSAVAFFWDGATILIYSQPNTPKLRNITANPSVAFALNTDAYGDHVLIIEGTAAVDVTAPAWEENEAHSAKFREAVVHWGGTDDQELVHSFSVAVRITPTRIRAW